MNSGRNWNDFKTLMDIKLVEWSKSSSLAKQSLEIAHKVLLDSLLDHLSRPLCRKYFSSDYETLFSPFLSYMTQKMTAFVNQNWAAFSSASNSNFSALNLGIIQFNSFLDDEISSPQNWDSAILFMKKSLKEYEKKSKDRQRELFGPGFLESYWFWSRKSVENRINLQIFQELEKMISENQQNLSWNQKFPSKLNPEEVATVRNLIRKNPAFHQLDKSVAEQYLSDDHIHSIFFELYKTQMISKSLQAASFCSNRYSHYAKSLHSSSSSSSTLLSDSPNGLGCSDVILFWRLQEMLQTTSKSLRQQLLIQKAKIERATKNELELLAENELEKKQLICGQRVDLAEKIESSRKLYSKLEAFIQAMLN
eukprot:Sdes_comp19399_c0_seq2m10713